MGRLPGAVWSVCTQTARNPAPIAAREPWLKPRATSLTAMTAPDLERLSGLLSATGPMTQVRSPLTGKIIATVPTSCS